MATPTSLVDHFFWLPLRERHGCHGDPREGVFSTLKLFHLHRMAGLAGIGIRHPHLFIVRGIPVFRAVTLDTIDLCLSHHALKVLFDQEGLGLLMAVHTGIGLLGKSRQGEAERKQC